MVLGNIEGGSQASHQKHLANLLSIVQKRSADQKRQKLNNKEPAAKSSINITNRSSVPKAALPSYHYKDDNELPHLEIGLKSTIEPRPYQLEALSAVTSSQDPSQNDNDNEKSLTKILEENSIAHSGIIVLPCGAGKTLTSILVACAVQKSVLVVCSTIIAAEQFQQEFLRSTTLMASRMGMFAGNKKWPFNGVSGVLFTTYTMLVENKNRSADSKRMAQFVEKMDWGLIILDEVHCGPAANYSKAITKIKTKVRLGLTATMLREDEKIGDLETIVGPTLYQAKWKELADRGYIAKVICTQVESRLSPRLLQAYDELSEKHSDENHSFLGQRHHMKSLLAILNPQKMQLCQRLIQYHEAMGDKVLVYCDHIEALKLYAEKLGRPYIYGGTSTPEAQALLKRFQIDAHIPTVDENGEPLTWSQMAVLRAERAKQINTLFLSRIGDTSLDLPAATVLIQVSSHFGSRRQEAQRLGRVLRAKKRNDKGFYSRFYTMVTSDTHEVTFSERRRQFLEDECGYGYQIWKVGQKEEGQQETTKNQQQQIGNGWMVDADPLATTPLDDEVKLDPLTCHIHGTGKRPYDTPEEEESLVQYIMGLKNVQVEEDDTDDSSLMTMASGSTKTASTGSKRKRVMTK
ncbi:P-loop containing nucleoside triphosphate hydrolase protein [Halteromyces radiatus]|uniref:P-loop containing nucleoside triphosphate hydrolase protein n=1 Tax=Halteromyces radiatus TaxID=101107 RepID=UPI00221EE8DC|nr:P-loop containing nucleoside triphosphate hydrolase protein [Halteromyces radiatus]KAI8097518.1 P-loop containing nucleoside triphosphate hydrolase protein [Halteromyces radiatus]